MTVKHLDHLNLTVTDLDETVEWYGRVFGFTLVEQGRRDGTRWAILRSGEALIAVYEAPSRHVATDAEIAAQGLHVLNHFGLRITDERAWLDTIDREGLQFSYPSPARWPHSTGWYVLDPSGHEIEVALWRDDTIAFGASRPR